MERQSPSVGAPELNPIRTKKRPLVANFNRERSMLTSNCARKRTGRIYIIEGALYLCMVVKTLLNDTTGQMGPLVLPSTFLLSNTI